MLAQRRVRADSTVAGPARATALESDVPPGAGRRPNATVSTSRGLWTHTARSVHRSSGTPSTRRAVAVDSTTRSLVSIADDAVECTLTADRDVLDRLLHKCHVLDIKGRSYRLRDLERTVRERR